MTIFSLMHQRTFVLHGTKKVAFIGENISTGFLFRFPPFSNRLILLFLDFGRKRHQVDPPLLSRLRQHDGVHKRIQRLQNLFLLKLQILQTGQSDSIGINPPLRVILKHLMNEFIESSRISSGNIL